MRFISKDIRPSTVAWYLNCSVSTVMRWKKRIESGMDIRDVPRSGRPQTYNEQVTLRLISFYCQIRPLNGVGQWTLRWAAAHLKRHPEITGNELSKSTIHRMLNKHGMRPHLSKYFLHITDPVFFDKMENLIQVYKSSNQYLFCFDECPGVQILSSPVPDMKSDLRSIGLRESHYHRNGTLDVMAFLRISDGTVHARCTENHKGETFRPFFNEHVNSYSEDIQLHYVMDNLSTHCNIDFCRHVAEICKIPFPLKESSSLADRQAWLGSREKRIVIHFTPFHGSWLNMVEIWFGILRKKCLDSRFESFDSMKEAIMMFVDTWNDYLATPFRWKYDGDGLYEKVVDRIIKFLKYNHLELTSTFLTKQFQIISNLIEKHYNRIPVEKWINLNAEFSEKIDFFKNLIESCDKKGIKTKAEISLKVLINRFQKMIA